MVALLLIVLWVRSYSRSEYVSAWVTGRGLVTIGSLNHRVAISFYDAAKMREWGWGRSLDSGKWSVHSDELDFETKVDDRSHGFRDSPVDLLFVLNLPAFSFEEYGSGFYAVAPHWLPVLIAAMFAMLPWLPWWSLRFSLRTLLVASTLVAVVLGLVVYVIR